MPLEELIRLNKFELCLMLLRADGFPELDPVRSRLSRRPSWAAAIASRASIQSMDWIDYNNFKRQVTTQVSRFLRENKDFAKKLRVIICDQFQYCLKTNLPVSALLLGVAKALADSFPTQVADILTAILFSHDALSALCDC